MKNLAPSLKHSKIFQVLLPVISPTASDWQKITVATATATTKAYCLTAENGIVLEEPKTPRMFENKNISLEGVMAGSWLVFWWKHVKTVDLM